MKPIFNPISKKDSDNHIAQLGDSGFTAIPQLLTPEFVDKLNKWISSNEDFTNRHQHYIDSKCLIKSNWFRNIITIDPVLYIIANTLGPNVKLSYGCLSITPKEEIIEDFYFPGYNKRNGLGFHRDGAFINHDLKEEKEFPRLTIKVAFWLSDLKNSNYGNLYVIPGSHKSTDDFSIENKHNAIPIKGNKGDVLIFDRRLIHGRSCNCSKTDRRVIFIEYSVRWINRKLSFSGVRGKNDIEQQLLSIAKDPWENYWPEKTLPLERWKNNYKPV